MEVDSQQQENQAEVEGSIPLSEVGAIAFDWNSRWLKGHEYSHMLKNVDAYCQQFAFQIYDQKTHPLAVYQAPFNGHIYFVRGKGLGFQFGFPRISQRKKYRWKKMNFTTNLPKKKPFVTYVVASALNTHNLMAESGVIKEFRMHAVIPYHQGANRHDSNQFILCHIRQLDHSSHHHKNSFETCFQDRKVDFYRLFLVLHNHYQKPQNK